MQGGEKVISKTKLTSKGQVTIPNEIRKALNMQEGDFLIFEAKSEYEANVKVLRSKPLSSLRGALKALQGGGDMAAIRDQAREQLAHRRLGKEGD
jgi:AbrB family looped-hinge helix DNA binding protein